VSSTIENTFGAVPPTPVNVPMVYPIASVSKTSELSMVIPTTQVAGYLEAGY